MNDKGTGLPVALIGKVKCKVVGIIKKGDMLSTHSQHPGVGKNAHEPAVGTVIGKALEDYDSTEIGTINIVVGKRAPENNCRQANSDLPVNMDFYLDFPQLCCNEKGPLLFSECQDKCWDHYVGPELMDRQLHGMGDGQSMIHVNIHE